jgi:hypothetical protein
VTEATGGFREEQRRKTMVLDSAPQTLTLVERSVENPTLSQRTIRDPSQQLDSNSSAASL